jgi:hypothetical protein
MLLHGLTKTLGAARRRGFIGCLVRPFEAGRSAYVAQQRARQRRRRERAKTVTAATMSQSPAAAARATSAHVAVSTR